ncbi:hypothetical protein DFJ73DRAFT_70210 [Zopfochytrium polystomum]|nr:hypothetical protein DFJ73DRAFT_70210 [Zopfochytrium polystomum]
MKRNKPTHTHTRPPMTTTKGDQQHQPASFEDLFISEIHRDDLDFTPKDDDNDDLLLLGTGGYGEQYEEADMRALYAAAAALPRPRNSPVSLSAVPPSRTAPWAAYFALEDDFDGARDTAASSREPPELEVLHGETLAQRLEVSVLSDLTGEDAAQRHPEELLVLQESDNLALRTRVQVPSVRLDRTVPKTAALWTRAMSVEMEKTFRFEDPVSENLSDAVVEEVMNTLRQPMSFNAITPGHESSRRKPLSATWTRAEGADLRNRRCSS